MALLLVLRAFVVVDLRTFGVCLYYGLVYWRYCLLFKYVGVGYVIITICCFGYLL